MVAGPNPARGSTCFYFFCSSRNSFRVNPACCIIESSVPFLIASCSGTVSLCFPSAKICDCLSGELFWTLLYWELWAACSMKQRVAFQTVISTSSLFRLSWSSSSGKASRYPSMASFMLTRACLRFSPWLMAPGSSTHCAEYPPSGPPWELPWTSCLLFPPQVAPH